MKKNFFDYVDKKRKSHSNKYEQYACYNIWFFMKYGFCSKDNLKKFIQNNMARYHDEKYYNEYQKLLKIFYKIY